MNELLRKLKDSGLILDNAQINKNPAKNTKYRLEDIFHGRWDCNESGEVFIMHEVFPFGQKHGSITISKTINSAAFFPFENMPSNREAKINETVFFDIETSSLSFGAGSFVFLIGISHFSEIGLETSLLLIDHPSAEKALLKRFNNEIGKFGIVCSYNGKTFDAPFIRNRYSLYRVDNILETKYHIDLLTYARRLWKLRIDSCKLSHVEATILHLKRDDGEIPGWMVPQVFFDFLNEQDPHLLEGILYHNKIDVISLAALYQHMSELLTSPVGNDRLDPRDCFSLAKLHESSGEYNEAKYFYQLGLNANKDKELAKKYYWNFGMLLKRIGDYSDAVQYWEKSAAKGGINACVELAKFYEHKCKDYNQALRWAAKAREIISIKNLETDDTRQKLQLDYRIDRINRKIVQNEK